jgi:hypothetical protein
MSTQLQSFANALSPELTEARAEIERLQSIANEFGRLSAKAELKLTIAKEGLLEIARVWDGYAPADVARRTLANLEQ